MAETSTKKFVASIVISLALLTATVAWLWVAKTELQQAPDVVLQIIDGCTIDLFSLAGKPVVVTFWATTCEVCIKKTPELKALYQRLKPRGFELIAVAMAYDPPNRVLAFSKDNEIPYPIALDLDGTVAKAFNDVSLTPTTFLIAPDGKIVLSKVGNINIENLEAEISSLLLEQKTVALNETS